MQSGRGARLYVAPTSGNAMAARSDVEAVAGEGTRGDRSFADALVHRGGPDARVVDPGRVPVDDRIRWERHD